MNRTDAKQELVLFRGFGGPQQVCLAGRLQYASHLVPEHARPGIWRRFRDAWRLLVSRRVPRARITLNYAGHEWTTRTDHHGYFFSCRRCDTPLRRDTLWRRFHCRAVDEKTGQTIETSGDVLNTPPQAERVIISDIDDTVVYTGVAHKIKMLWHLYLADNEHRAPFPGMDAFLRGLHRGNSGRAGNPMLYVSRSPWSIYPMLDAFFNRHGIPIGPVLLLRDWGISWKHPFPRRAEDHKALMITRVLQGYPTLPVILIGDSGQRDPEVYADIAARYRERIAAIYIRDLELSAERSAALAAMAARFREQGIHFLAARDTAALARDAAAHGWVDMAGMSHDERALFAERDAAAAASSRDPLDSGSRS